MQRCNQLVVAFCAAIAATAAAQQPRWWPVPGHERRQASLSVNDTILFNDGTGEALYVGGNFRGVTDGAGDFIARTRGDCWEGVGGGFDGAVEVLTEFQGALYAAGDFSAADGVPVEGIARWNGSAWEALGAGLNGPVAAMTAAGESLVVFGEFSMAAGVQVDGGAIWDGVSWSAFPAPLHSSFDNLELGVVNGTLTAWGRGLNGPGVSDGLLAVWDGHSWTAVVSQTSGSIEEVVWFGGTYVVGGSFSNLGPDVVRDLAQFQDGHWVPVGDAKPQSISLLRVDGDVLIASRVVEAGGDNVLGIAVWDGASWSSFAGLTNPVSARHIDDYGSQVFIDGLVLREGRLHILGPEADFRLQVGSNRVVATTLNGDLVVHGWWRGLGPVIARWRGHRFEPAFEGLGGVVDALIEFDGKLIAGGRDLTFDGANLGPLAVWEDETWKSLGISGSPQPFPCQVSALFTYADSLWVGGSFSSAEGQSVSNVARWDGNAWAPVGSGVPFAVSAFAELDDVVFLGGGFFAPDSRPPLAAWDGEAMISIDAPSPSFGVSDLVVFRNQLLMTGRGAESLLNIPVFYTWTGSSWAPAVTGFSGVSREMLVRDDALYIGGQFFQGTTYLGGSVLRWDGATATPLTGLEAVDVKTLMSSGPDFFAAGSVASANGRLAHEIARYSDVPPPCAADLTSTTDPQDPTYGVPDGVVDAADFFYFLDQFVAENFVIVDRTGDSDPSASCYGVPDDAVDLSDVFFYLDLFAAGCP